MYFNKDVDWIVVVLQIMVRKSFCLERRLQFYDEHKANQADVFQVENWWQQIEVQTDDFRWKSNYVVMLVIFQRKQITDKCVVSFHDSLQEINFSIKFSMP